MMIKFNNPTSSTNSSNNNLGVNNNSNNVTPIKKKYRKKPDPTAPKITRPCSECGKKFWSQKALFGHMRCHPERQWRGINPPPNFINRHQKEKSSSVAVASTSGTKFDDFSKMNEDDHAAALSLLMLANGFGLSSSMVASHAHCSDQCPRTSENGGYVREGVVVMSSGGGDVEMVLGCGSGGNNCRFECSSCKKVFGSPQALGGHRASHKNVKGCFANTRNNDGVFLEDELSLGHLQNRDGFVVDEEDNDKTMLMLGLGLGLNLGIQEQQQQHQCNICFRVFSSGQALGGHKRCHWEKFDGGNNNNEELGIDLNLLATTPPPSRIFEGEALDLRLGL
ncbi:hypothetical protein LIER_31604 [Lithospermum erythrorhizon]|uniref:C2H2-type domain-containing protein n=1 Tax=Lithospermum erythrorhizon TaxID=34254 RepID=A0AAV3RXE1_LITER